MNAAASDQVADGMLLCRKGTILPASPGTEDVLGFKLKNSSISMSFFIPPSPHRSSGLPLVCVTAR